MDIVTLLALVLFAAMIVAWLVLPSAGATGVTAEDAGAMALPVSQPNA
jgi:hypothetical protein